MEDVKSSKRDILQSGSSIYLRRNTGSDICEFEITGVKGEGSSALCYAAKKIEGSSSSPGILKEFYPRDNQDNGCCAFNLSRNYDSSDPKEKWQLKFSDGLTTDNFIKARDAFYNSFEIITAAKSMEENADLYDPIPYFEIYRGIADDNEPDNFTYYVWTPYDQKIKTFADVLSDICEETKAGFGKVKNLRLIIRSIVSLAQSIYFLHIAPMNHLDITPFNFGIRIKNNTLTGNISLIDLNTVCTGSDGRSLYSAGTPGFRNPVFMRSNVLLDDVTQACDFFSIGSCLYYALVMGDRGSKYENSYYIPPEKEEGITDEYIKERFENIEKAVENSPLFTNCDYTEDAALQKKLSAVLKKCLNVHGGERYEDASDIAADLEKIFELIEYEDIGESLSHNKNVPIVVYKDKEEIAEKNIKLGAAGAIQHFLYEHPLYDYAAEQGEGEKKKLEVLVLGLGNYATKFIDNAFQLMQINGYDTRITVASADIEEDKRKFLAQRKDFSKYFAVDGVAPTLCPETPYGEIDFISATFDAKRDSEKNENVICSICESTGRTFGFVFIAMHNDMLNRAVAEASFRVFEENNTVTGFVVFGDKDKNSKAPLVDMENDEFITKNRERVHPVDIGMTVNKHSDYKLLRRMAFNVHLTWEGSLEDLIAKKSKFAGDYNNSSSFAAALSIKYKLHSVGVKLDPVNPLETAKAFLARKKEARDLLIMYEHRRWIIEMLGKGYTVLPEEEYSILTSSNKDNVNKRHPCMVPSDMRTGEFANLSATYWKQNNYKSWDEDPKEKLSCLDPLDRMSVMLHRHYCALRDNTDFEEILGNVEAVQRKLEGKGGAENIFSAFALSLRVLYTEASKVRKATLSKLNTYSYYLKTFKNALKKEEETLGKETMDYIGERLRKIESAMFPMVQASKYVDYKAKDETIISSIPFILTYSTQLRLLIPLIVEDKGQKNTTGLFNNVASSIVLNPSVVTYVVDGEVLKKNGNGLVKSLEYIVNTMDRHLLQTKVKLLFLTHKPSPSELELMESVKSISNRIVFVDRQEHNGSDMHVVLENYLQETMLSRAPFTAIENNNTKISGCLNGCRDKEGKYFPFYSFASDTKTFVSDSKFVGWSFQYIPFSSSLHVDDLFVSKGKSLIYDEPEMQRDIQALWNIYKSSAGDINKEFEDAAVWKECCDWLSSRASRLMTSFAINNLRSEAFEPCEIKMPSCYKATYEKIIKHLETEELVKDVRFGYYTSGITLLSMSCPESVSTTLTDLMKESTRLLDPSMVCVAKRSGIIRVEYDSLYASNVTGLDDLQHREQVLDILDKISEMGLITGYTRPAPTMTFLNFTYCSHQVKKLLTNAGAVFEMFVYYTAIETGYFDEVRTGVSVTWNENSLENELDIVLVKDFTTIIVECKARNADKIEQEFYNKLYALSNTFGINNKAVLVADVCGRITEKAKLQISRGDEYDITTVYKSADITPRGTMGGIGEALKKISKGVF